MFKNRDTRQLAALRILFGILAYIDLLDLNKYSLFYYSDGGWLRAADEYHLGYSLNWTILNAITSPWAVSVFFQIAILASIFMILGFFTRPAVIMVFVAMISIINRSPMFCGEDIILCSMCFYLMFAKCGSSWSVDSFLKTYRKKLATATAENFPTVIAEQSTPVLGPAWPLLFIQVQICIVYLNTGLAKWHGEEWSRGTALVTVLLSHTVARWDLSTYLLNPHFLPFIKIMTELTLTWELSFAFLVLNRRTRWIALLGGVGMHLGILFFMQVHLFSQIMLAGYLAFLPNEWFVKFESWVRAKIPPAPSPRAMAIFDFDCRFYARLALLLGMLDVTRKIQWVSVQDESAWRKRVPQLPVDEAKKAFHFVTADGKVLTGSEAAGAIVDALPFLFPLIPFMSLSWFKKILITLLGGRENIQWVARNLKIHKARLKRFAIVSFCLIHFGFILVIMSPTRAYVNGTGIVQLPEPLLSMEEAIAYIRANAVPQPLVVAAQRYLGATWMNQRWGMFAPVPLLTVNYIEVRAVTGWHKPIGIDRYRLDRGAAVMAPEGAAPSDPAQASQLPLAPVGTWKDGMEPDYDPHPLYKSFYGSIEAHELSADGSYTRASKMAQSLVVYPNRKPYLESFARFWMGVYQKRYNKKPLAIHVILYQGHRDSPLLTRLPASTDYTPRVIAAINNEDNNVQKH